MSTAAQARYWKQQQQEQYAMQDLYNPAYAYPDLGYDYERYDQAVSKKDDEYPRVCSAELYWL